MENQLMQVIPQQATVTELKNTLPALLSELDYPKTQIELSLVYVYGCLDAIMRDPVLKTFPFHEATFPEVVYRVLKKGTQLQRAALSKCLTPKSCFFFPSASQQIEVTGDIQTVISEIMLPMFDLLCEHFGVAFSGNMETVAYSLLTEYGGLSFADFMVCFEKVKNGQYKEPYQHISTRGINAEFICTWLNKYCDEREDLLIEMRDKAKSSTVQGNGAEIPDAIKTAQVEKQLRDVERKNLEQQAQAIREKWESVLYESVVIDQWYKKKVIQKPVVDEYGAFQYDTNTGQVITKSISEDIICDASDPDRKYLQSNPIRIPKRGSLETLAKKIIYQFITFHNAAETTAIFNHFVDITYAKYSKEPVPYDNLQAEIKTVIASVSAIKRKLPAEKLIADFMKEQNEYASPKQIGDYVYKVIQDFTEIYFEDYLPASIERNYPAMTRKDFIWSGVLEILVKQGRSNPLKALFE